MLEFYGLRENAFGVTPDPRFLYPSVQHREALASLIFGIENKVGFAALIAEPGAGKTTLLFDLLLRYRDRASTAFVFNTQCSGPELLRHIAMELQIPGSESELDPIRLHQLFTSFVADRLRTKPVVIIIDEAQNLGSSALEALRLLSNFEAADRKLLHIILSGQPQLGETLRSRNHTQLLQRITTVSRLERLSPTQVEECIDYRLRVAGYLGPALFSEEALGKIKVASGGLPREINRICINAMQLGFALRQRQIGAEVIEEVLSDLNLSWGSWPEGSKEPGTESQSGGGEPKDSSTSKAASTSALPKDPATPEAPSEFSAREPKTSGLAAVAREVSTSELPKNRSTPGVPSEFSTPAEPKTSSPPAVAREISSSALPKNLGTPAVHSEFSAPAETKSSSTSAVAREISTSELPKNLSTSAAPSEFSAPTEPETSSTSVVTRDSSTSALPKDLCTSAVLRAFRVSAAPKVPRASGKSEASNTYEEPKVSRVIIDEPWVTNTPIEACFLPGSAFRSEQQSPIEPAPKPKKPSTEPRIREHHGFQFGKRAAIVTSIGILTIALLLLGVAGSLGRQQSVAASNPSRPVQTSRQPQAEKSGSGKSETPPEIEPGAPGSVINVGPLSRKREAALVANLGAMSRPGGTSSSRSSERSVARATVLEKFIRPVYPSEAKKLHVAGDVYLKLDIAADGSVQAIQVLSGNPLLAQAAKEAIKQWRYKPVLQSGFPVAVKERIVVTFRE
jgi:general secretion pathway protein A